MIVKGVLQDGIQDPDTPPGPTTWARATMRTWIEEGDQWAERIGHRYGIFGYNKRPRGSVDSNSDGDGDGDQRINVKGRIAGDVANAVVAYGMTKVSCLNLVADALKLIYCIGITSSAYCSLCVLFPRLLSWFG